MSDNQPEPGNTTEEPTPPADSGPLRELEELQQQIQRRIRDNQRFLDHFMDEDFPEEPDEDEGDGEEDEFFEEL